MTIEIRNTTPDEYEAAARVKSIALLQAPIVGNAFDEMIATWDEACSRSAWDGEQCVGNASFFPCETTVPGGAHLATGAVTRVGVLPTHRRQRIATRLIETLIADADEQPLAMLSLRATEATIYQRYGFGLAGDTCEVKVSPRMARPLTGAASGSFRLLHPGEVRDTVPAVFDRVGRRRNGAISRPRTWWSRSLKPAIDVTAASFVVVHLDDAATIDGYVHYDVTWPDTDDQESIGHGEVRDLFGATDEVELALWEYLINTDLITSWAAHWRPVDELLRDAARDPRAVQIVSVDDEQWLRLIDVDRSLNARTYGRCEDSVVIEVIDPLISGNHGRWQVDADGASRVDDAPDIIASIGALSAAYLGGRSWRTLTRTQAIEVRTEGAVQVADRLFGVDGAPFSGTFF